MNAEKPAPPVEPDEIFFGAAAMRFAKTLKSKLDKKYHLRTHVKGLPFMLALADFHAAGSMVWSREALIGYLYGAGSVACEVDGVKKAFPLRANKLRGELGLPAGLFADRRCSELSAVIFSNACSLAKLNRVAISAGGNVDGLRYVRFCNLFDRTPGALRGIPFCLDVGGEEYRSLWPQGREPWSAEIEVFHNPHAEYPAARTLLPEATHWFLQDGEMVCSSAYETSVLWSRTVVIPQSARMPTLADFV